MVGCRKKIATEEPTSNELENKLENIKPDELLKTINEVYNLIGKVPKTSLRNTEKNFLGNNFYVRDST